jgi:hypothetical protein
VVIGRGCLGRPWLFRELAEAFAGRPITPPPGLGEVIGTMVEHARLLVDQFGSERGIRSFRKHTSWYLKGFVVGGDARRQLGSLESLDQIGDILQDVDRDQPFPVETGREPRGHTHGPRPVKLPHGYLRHPESVSPLAEAATAVSGG